MSSFSDRSEYSSESVSRQESLEGEILSPGDRRYVSFIMAPMRSFSDIQLEISGRYSDVSDDRMSEGYTDVICDPRLISTYGMVSADNAIRKLEEELADARKQLKERDDKVTRLSLMQTTVDSEVQELTETLFQEAYKMVNNAEERREKAEKLQKEARLKVDVLSAEVEALKLIVSASGMGFNHHNNTSPLHQHKNSQHSPFSFKFLNPKKGSIVSSASFPVKTKSASLPSSNQEVNNTRTVSEEQKKADEVEEIDPLYYKEFSGWRDAGHPLGEGSPSPFLTRIYTEDIRPCMNFENKELSEQILSAIRENTIEVEPMHEEKMAIKTCVLTNVPRFCPYRVRVNGTCEWIQVSLLARNRIAAVCDFFTYLRYLNRGMLKCGVRDSYFDVIALRKNMALAKLGLGFVPKTTVSRPGSGFH